MLNKKLSSTQVTNTLAWIQKHPELIERLSCLQDISEDPNSDLKTLEQAERAVIEEIDRLGAEALKLWLCRRQQETSKQASENPDLRKHSKKNYK